MEKYHTHCTLIATYDVQDVKVKEIKGAVSVTCFFAAGSQAQGCRVIFKSNCSISDDPDINRKGDESEVEQVFSLPNGTYEIAIYDIEADGTQSEYPAYELDKQIVVQDSMSGKLCVFFFYLSAIWDS